VKEGGWVGEVVGAAAVELMVAFEWLQEAQYKILYTASASL
jgi:hypothetical protein